MTPAREPEAPVRLRPVPPYDPPYDDELPPEWRGPAGQQPLLDLHPGAAARSRGSRPSEAAPAEIRTRVNQPPAPATRPATPSPSGQPPQWGLPHTGHRNAGCWAPAAPGTGRQANAAPARSGGQRPEMRRNPPLPASASPATGTAAVRFVNTCLEIINGYRAVGHFRALAHPLAAGAVAAAMGDAIRRLRKSGATPLTGGRGALVKVRQMRTCEPRPGVAEVAVVVGARTGPHGRNEHTWALAFRLEHQHGRWLCTAARML